MNQCALRRTSIGCVGVFLWFHVGCSINTAGGRIADDHETRPGPTTRGMPAQGGWFAEYDDAQFRRIMESDYFRRFQHAERLGDIRYLSRPDLDNIALASSFRPLGQDHWYLLTEIALEHPCPITALAIYNSVCEHKGRHDYCVLLLPSVIRARQHRPLQDYRPIEAAIFASMKDEPSYFKTPWYTTHWWMGQRISMYNMYAKWAEDLAESDAPYMQGEWRKLATFQNNKEVRAAAQNCVTQGPLCDEAKEFSRLVQEIQAARERGLQMEVFRRLREQRQRHNDTE